MHLDLSIEHKTIIVAPLSWGLGHASRCIPIINQLLQQSNTVHLATDSEAFDLLSAEFPTLEIHKLPAYDVKYSYHSMLLNMSTQAIKVWKAIKAEQKSANVLAKEIGADIIISDNRLGFKSKHTYNIYLTHQLRVLASGALTSYLATKAHQSYYSKFDELWVPDYSGEKALAKRLSGYQVDKPVKYLGPISRLSPIGNQQTDFTYDLVTVLSGPEPQRSIFEKLALDKISRATNKQIAVVRGSLNVGDLSLPEHVDVFDMLTTDQLSSLIHNSKSLLCRAGYSTIMDLVTINRGATLVPTPGQHEQEYLGKVLNGKHDFVCIKQSDFGAAFRI